ncbi:DUF3592 domain-containing protein [Prosthecobacter sp. SYSU 5D2]|uniref:DUF3592 domain-containing protein n=1 Tax=Prosthecobacter sp. SYSU 5D2 TaxID=3134134 RepID=UPI0031FEA88A
MSRKRPRYASRGIAWLLMGSGLGALLLAAFMLTAALQSHFWPTVQGSISSYRVTKGSGKHITYGVRVTYSYWVEGRLYWGDVHSHSSDTLPGIFNSQEEALSEYAGSARFQPWQPGQPVTVHYDPQDPKDSVLRPGSTLSGWGMCAFGIILTGIGFYELAKFKRLASASENGSSVLPG